MPSLCPFVGVDFNADHLALARDAATSCGIDNVTFVHADFTTFASTHEGRLDFMTSHGVWSWVPADQRAALLHVAARSLKPGGLFYFHYMLHPGSTDLLPVQHLLNLRAHHMPGPSPRKAETGLKLLQQMADSGLFADRPHMVRHLANMARRAPADLAHEFPTDHRRGRDFHASVATSGDGSC
ncbi:class I SAM-dependent methyltransferase [Sphingobium sp.]|uniref:class I SAM-dependent methyltransferase n=1 Tax=Sphingobium sp. TaxID=1912891 RepID=UPI003B3AA8B6